MRRSAEVRSRARGVVLLVPGPGGLVRVRVQQHVAVLGDEPEQQPVHQAQQRPLEQIRVQVLAEPVVRRMPEEAGAEVGDRVRHSVAELIQGTRPGLDRLDPPLLQPAGRRRGAVRNLETGDVQQPVEQDELVEQLPVEHRLQVDLDERGARQRRGVPQQPELPAVGQDRPHRCSSLRLRHSCSIDCGGSPPPGTLWSRSVSQPTRWIGTCRHRCVTGNVAARSVDWIPAGMRSRRPNPCSSNSGSSQFSTASPDGSCPASPIASRRARQAPLRKSQCRSAAAWTDRTPTTW